MWQVFKNYFKLFLKSCEELIKIFFQVSSSCDGSFKIWDISSGNSVKAFPDMVPVCNDFFRATNLNRPAWQPQTGQYLALIKNMEVKIYERDTWELCQSLTDPEIKKV